MPQTLQEAAISALRQNLHDYDERHGYKGPLALLWQKDPPENQAPNEVFVPELAWSEEKIIEHLKRHPNFGELVPAVVTAVEEQSISVIDKSGAYRRIEWDGLAWARPFITDSKQGEAPNLATDILKRGTRSTFANANRTNVGSYHSFQKPVVH